MDERSDYREAKFDSFLNKTIILSSKKYYKEEITKDLMEQKIIDDDNYAEYLKEFIKYEDVPCNDEDVEQFISHCDNQVLVRALKSLSDIEMTVIFLLFEKELTSSEASKMLEICSDSVTRIKRRALKKLEDYFERM